MYFVRRIVFSQLSWLNFGWKKYFQFLKLNDGKVSVEWILSTWGGNQSFAGSVFMDLLKWESFRSFTETETTQMFKIGFIFIQNGFESRVSRFSPRTEFKDETPQPRNGKTPKALASAHSPTPPDHHSKYISLLFDFLFNSLKNNQVLKKRQGKQFSPPLF